MAEIYHSSYVDILLQILIYSNPFKIVICNVTKVYVEVFCFFFLRNCIMLAWIHLIDLLT